MKNLNIILIIIFIFLTGCTVKNKDSLPIPESSEGIRGDLGIDKNINEETIDNYLNRDDAVYRDVRMLNDTAEFEEIGGNSITDGIVEGFEIVPYPYLCNVIDLPEEVGESYKGTTLFTKTSDGYKENYDESLKLLEEFFPKDKIIFIMCGGGGYSGMTKDLLVYYGWDANRIYNVGGYWYYNGSHKVDIKKEVNGEIHYDLNNVIYHNIDFDSLNAKDDYVISNEVINTSSYTELDENNYKDIINSKEPSLIFVYLRGCSACNSFKTIINDVNLYNDLNIYQTEFHKLSKLGLKLDNLKFAPSLIVVKDGEILGYLNSDSDEDKEYYKKASSLSDWITNYISINKVSTSNINNEDCKDITCEIK